jgi:hypothetical protein
MAAADVREPVSAQATNSPICLIFGWLGVGMVLPEDPGRGFSG